MRYLYLFFWSLLVACAKSPKMDTPLPPQLTNPYLKQPSEKALYTPVKKLTLADGLSSNKIQRIFKDSKGFIWIGTDHGLNRYDGLTIKNYWYDSNGVNSLWDNNIIDIAEDSLGTILVLTQKGVNLIQLNQSIGSYTNSDWIFFFYKHKTRTIFTIKQQDNSDRPPIFRFAKDSKNNFWQIDSQAAFKIDPTLLEGMMPIFDIDPFLKFPLVAIHKNDRIEVQPQRPYQNIKVDNQDSSRLNGIETSILDISQLHQLLIRKDDFKYLFASDDLDPNYLLLEQNNIWIGTNKGVIHYSKGINLFEYAPVTASTSNYNNISIGLWRNFSERTGKVYAVFPDSKKRIWIGAERGLFQEIDTILPIHYGQEAGFQQRQIDGIEEDNHGQLWLSMLGGNIVVFSPELEKVIHTFTEDDGLMTNNLGHSGAKMTTGHLVFGSINQEIVRFHPDSLYRNMQPPTVVITSVTANEVEKYSVDPKNYTFTLPYDSNSLIITPRILDLNNSHRNKIRYKLEGVDADYCKPLAVKDLHYPHLAAGDYTLLIQGANSHGVWNPQPTLCHLTILPAWWQTWWFRIVISGVIIGIGVFYWWQHFTLQKHQGEMDALQARVLQAQLNPHFIFNVLALAQSKIMNESPQEASDLLVRLAKLLRNFLESSILSSHESGQFHEIELEKEIELLTEYINFERIKNDNRFEYHLTAPDIEPSNEKLPPFFIQPFVENAIKHGLLYRNDDQGILTVTFNKKLEQGDAYLVCTVSDNGVGIKRAKALQTKDPYLHKSRGGELVEKRRKILNSYNYDIQINTYDNEPSGTKVVIQFKYKS